jgi:hypothetical protein
VWSLLTGTGTTSRLYQYVEYLRYVWLYESTEGQSTQFVEYTSSQRSFQSVLPCGRGIKVGHNDLEQIIAYRHEDVVKVNIDIIDTGTVRFCHFAAYTTIPHFTARLTDYLLDLLFTRF